MRKTVKKASKLISVRLKRSGSAQKPVAIVFGMTNWFDMIESLLSGYKIINLPERKKGTFEQLYKKDLAKYKNKNVTFFIWGYRWAYNRIKGFQEYADKHKIKVIMLEDGFIRSVGLGRDRALPISVCSDSVGLYYNAQVNSDLETILNTYDFKKDSKLLTEAAECMELLLNLNLSKYNNVAAKDATSIYGAKTKKRILVIGQVEDDFSIQYGCNKKLTNNELVLMARIENPDAEIIYKPHPDVLFGKREGLSNPDNVTGYAKVITEPLSLPDSFHTIDHVYTMTSLSGFEALMRGIPVTTFGCPFYSGWGLTEDRQPNPRRTRKLSVLEVFAGAYILYSKYFSLHDRREISLREAIMEMKAAREQAEAA